MTTRFTHKGFEFELLNGEYRRYVDVNEQSAEYLCIAKHNDNKLLLQYVDTTGLIIDYVQTLMDNLPNIAFDYLMDVISQRQDVLARVTFTPATPTGFEIYYDCDYSGDDIDGIIGWMLEHNDWAAESYRYTEIVNGHQKCVGE
jgi:hypothetical protein